MVEIREADLDIKAKTAAVSFSSETDTVRFLGIPQVLLHEKDAADFSRLHSVLFNHNPDVVVGKAEDVRIDEKEHKGRGTIRFDDDADGERVFKKVQSGSVRGVSVGFRVDAWMLLDDGTKWKSPDGREFTGPMDIATKWRAIEFSLTPIPADDSVGVGRTAGRNEPETTEGLMDPKTKAALIKRGLIKADATDEEAQAVLLRLAEQGTLKPEPKNEPGKRTDDDDPPPAPVTAPAPTGSPAPAATASPVQNRADEIIEIMGLCDSFAPGDTVFRTELTKPGVSLDEARKRIVARLAKENPPMGTARRLEIGEEERTKFSRSAEAWLTSRTSRRGTLDEKGLARASEVPCFTLLDLARESCRRANIQTAGMTRDALIQRAISHSTSDFSNILAAVANKTLLAAYREVPATWRPLVRVTSLPDFKAVYRNRLGDAGDLAVTPELAPMPEGSFAENVESYQLATYSKRFGISRQAIINDDLSAFDRIPSQMGAAAARVPASLFWALLVSASGVGPTMAEDSEALFSTSHDSGANYTTGAFAISIDNLGSAKKLMRLQKGLAATGETAPTLNIQPQYLLVPAALENLALQVVSDITPATIATSQPVWIKSLQVIVEPKLDAATNGTTAWYLVANPNTIDGAEIGFLDGREEPSMIRVEGTNILGVEWGVYLDCAAKFVDHRGWYRAKGA